MPDNVEIGPNTFATDELADGVQVQRMKVQYGIDGEAYDVSDLSPMPVQLVTNTEPVFYGNPLPVISKAPVSTVVSVTSSTSTVSLRTENGYRCGVLIYNAATTIMYVKFGTGASTSSYSFQLAPAQFYESGSVVPMSDITAVWAGSPTGNALITEMTQF